jgi:ribosomal protein S1
MVHLLKLAPGVEGLIHVSEMSWSQHLRSAQEFMKVGDEVEAVILTFDREERKMSLGIKQLKSRSMGRNRRNTQSVQNTQLKFAISPTLVYL